ncbi:hypothetical protein PV334_35290 [Streptomyces sp. ME02-7008A-1]|uniref:hypothetical protein n=1 Tax=unclassified Streptomyces TaxID=2593676 RepID=UPI0029A0383A|nr:MULTISPECIES: hypothetical protein [unclassified Streptomyces]MDX3186473.1 hypothetical protein [Streptomyces sp. ME02-7008A-1]MDX3307122.1 hypothetical protein [Streptomyces sp. ME02-7008A]
MDGSVWVGLGGTLAGTMIGGGLSIWASMVTQNRQAKATRDLRTEEKSEASANDAITQLYVIRQRARDFPQEREGWGTWRKDLARLAAEMEPAVLRLRDDALRERIEEVLSYMDMIDDLTDYRVHGGSLMLPSEVCRHGLDCLGAAVRNRPLPAASQALLKAREIDALERERMAIAREETDRLLDPGGISP